jgi:hypothetical protein
MLLLCFFIIIILTLPAQAGLWAASWLPHSLAVSLLWCSLVDCVVCLCVPCVLWWSAWHLRINGMHSDGCHPWLVRTLALTASVQVLPAGFESNTGQCDRPFVPSRPLYHSLYAVLHLHVEKSSPHDRACPHLPGGH